MTVGFRFHLTCPVCNELLTFMEAPDPRDGWDATAKLFCAECAADVTVTVSLAHHPLTHRSSPEEIRGRAAVASGEDIPAWVAG